ncbi:sigma-70 family RNA polymerase sigma factor [Thalassoglobus polymorphus]|uniref:RNA polymerase sigma factor SigM n=1 Tax=Thalassoglobus polymorphus TaxID=2527994 RepID=A0A517QNF2_9PLAN|nr:sigma-70 family RNA polymerase sigma factor [Thalassoglobus polymorphus]QDT33124.1 RNA polymerase sigma factor SigM [Thalassoglobus polymorphus]
MEQTDNSEIFVRHLTEHQNRIYGYVFSLVGDHSRAADVVQETNLVLWRKIGEFKQDREFLPWAFAIARIQVLAHLRDRKRDRLLLDAELAEAMSVEAEKQAEKIDIIREALRPCLQVLTPTNRELIERRYFRSMSIDDVAESVDRTTGAVKVALLRIRRQLADCVQQRTTAGG